MTPVPDPGNPLERTLQQLGTVIEVRLLANNAA
jgi:hypothetical protein